MKKVQAIVGSLINVMVVLILLFFVSPDHPAVIGIFIMCTGIAITLFIWAFYGKKSAILSGLFVCLFLIINAIAGFEIINTLLLISFIIGIAMLW